MNKTIYKYDFNKKIGEKKFSIKQAQLKAQKSFYDPSVKTVSKTEAIFKCEYNEHESFNHKKPTILLSIKDNSELLKITLNNLHIHNTQDHTNILVIDDRPETKENQNVAIDFGCSYIKVDNTLDIFNFSMLHNLAVHVLNRKHKNLAEIILWNSDLWMKDSDVLPELLKLHTESQSTITGTKLVYPDSSFEYYESSIANLVQFGGSMFAPRPNELGLFPWHLYRGYKPNDEKVNCNKGELFITGAFMIIDSEWFIKSGGFCPVFTICFQDVDLCLRATTQDKKVLYFGKDLQLYHYESYLRGKNDEKLNQETAVDSKIYTQIWDYERIKNLLWKFY